MKKYSSYDPFLKELILSTYHLSADTVEEYINAIKKYKVKALNGYPSAIGFISRYCIDHEISLPLTAVLTSSEVLSEDTRHDIETAFQCKVFDYYGAAERVCYIHTCEYGSYHIIPEYGYTELIPKENSDEYSIIATGFWNTAMPFIRYDTGDSVVLSDDRMCLWSVFSSNKINSGAYN